MHLSTTVFDYYRVLTGVSWIHCVSVSINQRQCVLMYASLMVLMLGRQRKSLSQTGDVFHVMFGSRGAFMAS